MKPNIRRVFELADEVEHFDLRSRGELEPDQAIAYLFRAAVKRFVGAVRRLDDAELLEELVSLDMNPPGSLHEAWELHADLVPIIDHLRDKIPNPLLEDSLLRRIMASTTKGSPDSISERRQAVDAYIEEVREATGKRITRKDFWREAGYKAPSDFERWQRNDPKTTKAAERNFDRVLRDKPHLKRL